jgi:hypothetical protein
MPVGDLGKRVAGEVESGVFFFISTGLSGFDDSETDCPGSGSSLGRSVYVTGIR